MVSTTPLHEPEVLSAAIQELGEANNDDIKQAEAKLKDKLRSRKYSEKEQHFLMIGKSGVGKTCLSGFLADGESGTGTPGPDAGTTDLVVTTSVEINCIKYSIHDTKGLGDGGVDLEEMKAAVKRVYNKHNCLVIVCIRWDDRLVDYNSTLPLDVCNSLGDDVWSKVIIAITHSDKLPPDIKDVAKEKENWKKNVRNEICKQGVPEETFKKIPICFTSHTMISKCEVEPFWKIKLFEAIVSIAPHLQSAFDYLLDLFKNQQLIPEVPQHSSNAEDESIIPFNIMKEAAVTGAGIGSLLGQGIGAAVGAIIAGDASGATLGATIGQGAGTAAGVSLATGLCIWLCLKTK
jgi:predicted GTPase